MGKNGKKRKLHFIKKKSNKLKAVGESDYKHPIEELVKKTDRKESKTDINNLSSIAFILIYDGKRILFLGDATPTTIKQGLQEYLNKSGEQKIKCEYVKLPHHGSIYNYSESLFDLIDCNQFIVCANGDNSHKLPNKDKETLAKILCHPKRNKDEKINFIFNYSNTTLKSIFKVDKNGKKKYHFDCSYPKGSEKYYEIKL